MGAFSRLRYVIAANVNALLEKAEDPEKLLRALIREMEDAKEEARLACADLLAEQQRLARLESRLASERDQWQSRAEKAVAEDRDDLARAALTARAELVGHHQAARDEQDQLAERIRQMEADMQTLKSKLADAKRRLQALHADSGGQTASSVREERLSPGERRIRRAMGRFDRLQSQVDSLEARVRSYEVGGTAVSTWSEPLAEARDPAIESELEELKARISGQRAAAEQATES